MACCLMAPSHYLNQCCLIISKVQWHSIEGNFTSDSSVTVCLINKLTAGFHCSTVSHKIIFAYIELPNLQLWDANNVHDDVIKWKHFPRHWPFVQGINRSPVNSPHKGQWRRALMFSLICAWINGWVNNREAGDLRCHHTHCDITVMFVLLLQAPWRCSLQSTTTPTR